MSGQEGEAFTYRGVIQPTEMELVVRPAGADGAGGVLTRFEVPVLLCHDDTTDRGWKVDHEAMERELMSQVRAWALAETRPQDDRVE